MNTQRAADDFSDVDDLDTAPVSDSPASKAGRMGCVTEYAP